MSGGQRIADYFIVTGLPTDPILLENATGTDSQRPKTSQTKTEPITDICVIIPSSGEECPPGSVQCFPLINLCIVYKHAKS